MCILFILLYIGRYSISNAPFLANLQQGAPTQSFCHHQPSTQTLGHNKGRHNNLTHNSPLRGQTTHFHVDQLGIPMLQTQQHTPLQLNFDMFWLLCNYCGQLYTMLTDGA
jgi:hypothetical protein